METELQQIQSFIQAFVNAIAAILNVQVTVIDKNRYRIAATDKYANLGERIEHSPFFDKVLRTGQPSILENAKCSDLCNQCASRFDCTEFADIAYPIFFQEKVSGIISIAAFSETERQLFSQNKNKFEQFLKYMSMLISSKIDTLQHSHELEQQIDEVINKSRHDFNEVKFIGENPAIRRILSLANKVSSSDSTVLIMGESGTGKEVIANIIHNNSPRSNKLMISVNCSAIPEHLLESELFGYEAGAFTGAKSAGHIGKFELANNSTLFLDEIGEMPLLAQVKVLRVIQEKKITRIGGTKDIPINVRIICATNQNLLHLVNENRFRADLFYRINVISMIIPPLKQRTDDIPLLIDSLLHVYNKKFKKNIRITPSAMQALMAYDWPGNVRELKNTIEYLANIKDDSDVELSDLPNQIVLSSSTKIIDQNELFHLKNLLFEYEKGILMQLLKNATSTEDKKMVAARLGIGLSTLYKKMELFQIK